MNRLPLFVACLGLLCGCASSASYRTVVQIQPASAPGEYYVWARLTEQRTAWYGNSLRSLSSPVMTCAAGKPAKAEISTDGGQSGTFIEAYIAPVGDEKDTTCTFRLKRGGKVLTSTEVRLPPIVGTPLAAE